MFTAEELCVYAQAEKKQATKEHAATKRMQTNLRTRNGHNSVQFTASTNPTDPRADGEGAKGKFSDSELASQYGVTQEDDWLPVPPSSVKAWYNPVQRTVSG